MNPSDSTAPESAPRTFSPEEAQQLPRVDFGDLVEHFGRAEEGLRTTAFGTLQDGSVAVAEVNNTPGAQVVVIDTDSQPDTRARVCALYRLTDPAAPVILPSGNQQFSLPDSSVDFCAVPEHQPDWDSDLDDPTMPPECALDLGALQPVVDDALAEALHAHTWLLDQIAMLPTVVVPASSGETSV